MVTETSQRVKELIKTLCHGNHTDEMTKKMAIPNTKSATNSSFLYPYKDSQTERSRETDYIRL